MNPFIVTATVEVYATTMSDATAIVQERLQPHRQPSEDKNALTLESITAKKKDRR